MYYRIRERIGGLNGKVVIVADNLKSLEQAYSFIIKNGKHTNKKFLIDEVETTLFSKLTAKEAQKRLDEIRAERENRDG